MPEVKRVQAAWRTPSVTRSAARVHLAALVARHHACDVLAGALLLSRERSVVMLAQQANFRALLVSWPALFVQQASSALQERQSAHRALRDLMQEHQALQAVNCALVARMGVLLVARCAPSAKSVAICQARVPSRVSAAPWVDSKMLQEHDCVAHARQADSHRAQRQPCAQCVPWVALQLQMLAPRAMTVQLVAFSRVRANMIAVRAQGASTRHPLHQQGV